MQHNHHHHHQKDLEEANDLNTPNSRHEDTSNVNEEEEGSNTKLPLARVKRILKSDPGV